MRNYIQADMMTSRAGTIGDVSGVIGQGHSQNLTLQVCTLGVEDAGEILTLQRAAYLTEAAAHNDFELPPLVQSLDELRTELLSSDVIAFGLRDGARLIGAVRLREVGAVAELGRLTVVPDRQGEGIGAQQLQHAESALHNAQEIRLFTGEHSTANLRLYTRHGYHETERTPAGEYYLVHFVKPLIAST